MDKIEKILGLKDNSKIKEYIENYNVIIEFNTNRGIEDEKLIQELNLLEKQYSLNLNEGSN